MAFEEVLSDHDSEDEVDDDVADFEDRRVRCDNLFPLLLHNHGICAVCYLGLIPVFAAKQFNTCYFNVLTKCRCLVVSLTLRKMTSV